MPSLSRRHLFSAAAGAAAFAAMPRVADCAKQDYQVLIVIGVPKTA